MVIPIPVLKGEERGGEEGKEDAEGDDEVMVIPIQVLEGEEWGGEKEEEEAEWHDQGDGDSYTCAWRRRMRRRGEEGGSRMRWQMRWWWRQCTPCPGWNDHVFGWLLQIKALHYFFPIKFFINQKTIQHLQCFAFCNWEALLSISIQIWGKTFAAQKNVVIPRGKGRKQPAVLGIVFGLRAVSCLPPGAGRW